MNQAEREDLLVLIADSERRGDQSLLPSFLWPADQVGEFAHTHGLDPVFVHLTMSLAMGEAGFWGDAIGRLSPGADTRLASAGWIEWLWSDPAVGAATRVTNAMVRANGDAVCALHRRAATGEEVGRADWRRARASLAASDEHADAVERAAAEVAAAVAWDLDVVPGAPADMIYAWKTMLFAEIERDLDWSADKQAALEARRDRMGEAAREAAEAADAVARAGSDESDGDGAPSATYMAAFGQAMTDFAAAHPSDLDRHGERTQAAYVEMYRVGRKGLLRQISAPADAVGATVDA